MSTPSGPRRTPSARQRPGTPPSRPPGNPSPHLRPGTPASSPGLPPHPAPPADSGGPRYLAGRYRLEAVLGRGAMGTVWAAYDEVVHRRVAIKEIYFPTGMPAGEQANLADRTMREARAIGALSHPHVITLYDILTVDRRPYIVMELLQARSLAEVIKQDGPMPDGSAATIGVAVAGGLLAAHHAGITHRDVKPGNVLIGNDGRIKLTDFGIARSADEPTMTVTGLLLGSPAYIAPEVAGGEPATPAADAWGLGALLYTTVEGRPPFDRGEPIATLTAVVADPVPPHRRSGRIGPVIDGLLAKDPHHRMTVAQALELLWPSADDPTGDHPPWGPGRMPGGPATRGAPGSSRSPGPLASPRSARSAPGSPSSVSAPPSRPHWPIDPVPPPPWADRDVASLPPLPAASAPRRPRWVLPVAVLVAIATAAAGFFAVRLVADWGENSVTNGTPATVQHAVVRLADATQSAGGVLADAPDRRRTSSIRFPDGPRTL